MNLTAYHCHPYAKKMQKIRQSFVPYKLLPVLLLPPIIVIYLRLTLWGVNPILTNILIADAILLFLFVFVRIGLLLIECHYGIIPALPPRKSKSAQLLLCRESELHTLLLNSGYRYDCSSSQGIKCGKLTICALLLLLVGMCFVIPVGIYDNLKQFSGILYLGSGSNIDLSDINNYGIYSKGPLADPASIYYKLKGYENVMPSANYPSGGKDLSLYDMQDNELWRGILTYQKRQHFGNYVIQMEGFVYDVFLYVETLNHHFILTDRVRCMKTVPSDGSFTHSNSFYNDTEQIRGEAWYDLINDKVRVRATIKDKKFDVMLGMGPEFQKEVDGYRFKFTGVGKWAHINVMRSRNIVIMKTGALMLAVGLVLFALFPFRRVWIFHGDSVLTVKFRDRKLHRDISGVQVNI